MARVWAWFNNPSAVLSLAERLGDGIGISMIVHDPKNPRDVIILGSIAQDMGCYPFLDVRHQMRRLGLTKSVTERFSQVLRRHGALVCLESMNLEAIQMLGSLGARDIMISGPPTTGVKTGSARAF